jgi:uncharacterized protein YbjT (DUF2867 family)
MALKILVTGATGKVGKGVVTRLMGKGLSIKAADINKDWVDAAIQSEGWEGVESVLFNYDSPETFENAMDGVGPIFIVPPLLSPRQHQQIIAFVDYAVKNGATKIVNLSQMGSQDIPDLPIGKAEKHIETLGIPYTHLRPNWFMQNFNSLMLEMIRDRNEIRVPAGDFKSSYIDNRDISACGAVALTTDKHDYSVITQTGPKALDHYEVAKIISEATGKNITYTPITEDQYAEDLKSAEMPDASVEMFLNLYRLLRAGGTAPVSTDVADCLGRPQITFEQYAKDFADSWK